MTYDDWKTTPPDEGPEPLWTCQVGGCEVHEDRDMVSQIEEQLGACESCIRGQDDPLAWVVRRAILCSQDLSIPESERLDTTVRMVTEAVRLVTD